MHLTVGRAPFIGGLLSAWPSCGHLGRGSRQVGWSSGAHSIIPFQSVGDTYEGSYEIPLGLFLKTLFTTDVGCDII